MRHAHLSEKFTSNITSSLYIASFIPNVTLTQLNQSRKLNKIYSAFTRGPLLSI